MSEPLVSLLTEARQPARERGLQRRKSNRLLASGGWQMIGSLSQFMAARNVIHSSHQLSAHSDAYDKLVNDDLPESYEQMVFPVAPVKHNQEHKKHQKLAYSLTNNNKIPVKLLLCALLSRKHKNKGFLVMSLLRAPVVLAALFSLILFVTMMVFYMLSFNHYHSAHCQQHLQSVRLRASQMDQNQEASQLAPHIISSRHLQQQPLNTEVKHQALNSTAQKKIDPPNYRRALTVETECGSFLGSPDAGGIVFKGIPYASPPVGKRRWTRPRPIWLDPQLCRPAESLMEALESRPHCAQLSPVDRHFSGQEDCLYLDIYTPQLDSRKNLPVMVYIHGGFLAFGSSGQGQVNWMKAQPSAQLASELQVVLVAFNYRLQALGFMTLVSLAKNNGPEGSEGNYGLWDQLAALNWIKRNIESFGGDPNNVVLFGPDSAAALPLALISRQDDQRAREKIDESKQDEANNNHSLHFRDLYQAIWLTNPALYYELPYELASQHYQRLLLNQWPCVNSSSKEAGSEHDQSGRTLECLVGLSSEQVVRHYLGKDDPSYRLDDQNSMPIHGIFADQFVTVDRELVQDSYPFHLDPARPPPPQSGAPPEGSHQQSASAPSRSKTRAQHPSLTSHAHYTRSNESVGNYDDGHHHGHDDNCGPFVCARSGKRLLLGSTAQAVEFWPCPMNLDQWTWDDFKRYVATSLNSFDTDTYTRASQLYQLPLATPANTTQTSPKETYLTMVSDIRQVCPTNELAVRLQAKGHQIHRYIVESVPNYASRAPPRAPPPQRQANLSGLANQDQRQHYEPEYAFHSWDLVAFFGFQFDPNFHPDHKDLEFQAQIRQMVRRFAHRGQDNNNDSYTLFTKDASKRHVKDYKVDECKMWLRHLGRSYAWVS